MSGKTQSSGENLSEQQEKQAQPAAEFDVVRAPPTPPPQMLGLMVWYRAYVSTTCQPISPCDYDDNEGDNRSDDEGRIQAVPLLPLSRAQGER